MTTADPSNPLQAPTASVPNLPPLPTTLRAEPRGMPLGAGMQWVSTGWEMFKAAPGPWVGIFLVYIIVTGVVSLLPFLNILNLVLYPILTAGLVAACAGTPRRSERIRCGLSPRAPGPARRQRARTR